MNYIKRNFQNYRSCWLCVLWKSMKFEFFPIYIKLKNRSRYTIFRSFSFLFWFPPMIAIFLMYVYVLVWRMSLKLSVFAYFTEWHLFSFFRCKPKPSLVSTIQICNRWNRYQRQIISIKKWKKILNKVYNMYACYFWYKKVTQFCNSKCEGKGRNKNNHRKMSRISYYLSHTCPKNVILIQ